MQDDREDQEGAPCELTGRGATWAARAARGFRSRPRRVVCARPAVRAAAGRLRVCAGQERRPPSLFRAGCAPSTGVCTECLLLGGGCVVGKAVKEEIAKPCLFFCFQSNSPQI
ncbi:UDP-GalNAc:beta-1,3-N-acetylgalactosaminyltransferase 1 isoform X2 [Trachypithecus francoisi]|uniref:UDP-GalNAc:beta-1, 3-N-acetylgalactosaminyltransferase 1 isoform X2 n=1 Tax=Trachypithecus francoisi TaxID=54180 RepID=UPI00141ABC05|nr:UDP-GalNAc:beta-1,3-N-acetylgalactosaminyltransferase 1 isoform X2 [Trachypithecus francoisi]XP_033058585.1 UDP-GalNAc:beta-1,3-N-acetylgalactosaminyltransferase 1 isoform X2 [Trachypithecus francoisi]